MLLFLVSLSLILSNSVISAGLKVRAVLGISGNNEGFLDWCKWRGKVRVVVVQT